MMYRPTVRYHDVYREYINEVFRVTSLDRNQIIRLALFTAAECDEFQSVLKPYKTKDVPLPSPNWEVSDNRMWLEQNPTIREEGRDVNHDELQTKRANETTARQSATNTKTSVHRKATGRSGEVHNQKRIPVSGNGIKFTL